MFDWMPVQSFHNSTANFRVHASVTFLVYGDNTTYCGMLFLNIWKLLLFNGDGFAGVQTTDPAMISLLYETFFTNCALILKIYSACSFMDVMFSSRNFWETSASCFSCTCTALLKANLIVSVFCTCATCSKWLQQDSVQKFWLLSGKIGKTILLLLLLFFQECTIQNFERLSMFPEHPINFHDFQEWIR